MLFLFIGISIRRIVKLGNLRNRFNVVLPSIQSSLFKMADKIISGFRFREFYKIRAWKLSTGDEIIVRSRRSLQTFKPPQDNPLWIKIFLITQKLLESFAISISCQLYYHPFLFSSSFTFGGGHEHMMPSPLLDNESSILLASNRDEMNERHIISFSMENNFPFLMWKAYFCRRSIKKFLSFNAKFQANGKKNDSFTQFPAFFFVSASSCLHCQILITNFLLCIIWGK